MNYSENANKKKSANKKSHNKKRKNSIGIIILRLFFIVVAVGAFAVLGGALGAYMGIIENTSPLNTKDVTPESYTSIIYDCAGNEIDKLHGDENREYIKLDFIPKDLQNAVVAIEDERFYEHNGIDLKGIMRAVMVNVQSGDMSQGASTLTQQLIKNEALSSEKKLTRKVQEQYLAVIFERDLQKQLGSKKAAKNYILELYLNSIALNHGLNGVQVASEFYFGKEVAELTLAESACIAGITQNPSANSPISNPENNKKRQTMVLNKMLTLGYITKPQYDEAMAEDIYANLVGKSMEEEMQKAQHSYFVDALIVQIADDLMSQKNMNRQQAYNTIYSSGLQVNATVDMGMQTIVDDSFKNDALFPPRGNTLDANYALSVMDNATQKQTHINEKETVYNQEEAQAFAERIKAENLNESNTIVAEKLTVTESLQSAMVVMDYHNGEVKALIGGRGEKQGDLVFNRATQALRQPGSCFKPLASYAPAIDLGILSPGSIIMDQPLELNGKEFENWSKSFKGPSTAREGIRDSMNILAIKVLMMVGYDKSLEYLKNFGFTTLVDAEERNGKIFSDKGPATALGGITDGVSVMEITGAYSTIANSGQYYKPKLYSFILDHDGNILLDNRTVEPKRVIKDSTAFMVTDMMKEVITGGGSATGRLANFRTKTMTIAGKTGTTSDDKDLTFVGYTPYYCAGIWLGYDVPRTMSYDKSYHLLMWRDIMEKIHADLPNKEFEIPDTVTKKSVCTASGMDPIPGVCSRDYFGLGETRMDYVAVDNVHSGRCNLHKLYKMDVSTGYLATKYCGATKSVALAVDADGNVVNGSANVAFNSYCPVHSASNRGKALVEYGVSGDDYDSDSSGSSSSGRKPQNRNDNDDDNNNNNNNSNSNSNEDSGSGNNNAGGSNQGSNQNNNAGGSSGTGNSGGSGNSGSSGNSGGSQSTSPGMPPQDWEYNETPAPAPAPEPEPTPEPAPEIPSTPAPAPAPEIPSTPAPAPAPEIPSTPAPAPAPAPAPEPAPAPPPPPADTGGDSMGDDLFIPG